jgi:hypothetical protein
MIKNNSMAFLLCILVMFSLVIFVIVVTDRFPKESNALEFQKTNAFFEGAQEIPDIDIVYTQKTQENGLYNANLIYDGEGMAEVYYIYTDNDIARFYKASYGKNDHQIKILLSPWLVYVNSKMKFEIYVFVCDPHGNKFKKHYTYEPVIKTENEIHMDDVHSNLVDYCKSKGTC